MVYKSGGCGLSPKRVLLVIGCFIGFLAAGLVRPGLARAASQTISLAANSRGYCLRGTETVYADAITVALNDTSGGCNGSVSSLSLYVAGASTPVASCTLFAGAGNLHCAALRTQVTYGWNSIAAATLAGLRPGQTYLLEVGQQQGYWWIAGNVTTEGTTGALAAAPAAGATPQSPQVTVTITSDLFESAWTLTQSRLGAGGAVAGTRTFTVDVPPGGQGTWTSANQQPGATYAYSASAAGLSATGPYHDRWTLSATPAAPAPTAPAACRCLDVAWPALPDVSDYAYSLQPGGTTDVGAATTATLAGLQPNTQYAVSVRAVGLGLDGPAARAWTAAAPPAAAQIDAATQTAISVRWQTDGNPSGTTYEVAITAAGGAVAASATTTATQATVGGLTCGDPYHVGVRAINGAGVATAWTATGTTVTVPCPPPALTGENGGLGWRPAAGRGWVTLQWPAVAGATGYRVWIFGGHQAEPVDVGDATSWDSRRWLGYPTEAAIAGWTPNSVCGDPFLSGSRGVNLRDDPSGLYAKTCGIADDASHAYRFTVSAYNAQGDSGTASGVAYAPTLPVQTDPGQPQVSSLNLDGDAQVASAMTVPVTAAASESLAGVCAFALSNDSNGPASPDFDGRVLPLASCSVGQIAAASTSADYAGTWRLTAGPGIKSVYGWAESAAGVWSLPARATIYVALNAAAPAVTLSFAGGLHETGSPAVTLQIAASGGNGEPGAWQMRFSGDGSTWTAWRRFAAAAPWSLAGGPGLKTVYAQVRDADGLVGQGQAMITLTARTGSAVATGSGGPVLDGGGVLQSDSGTSGQIMRNGAEVPTRFTDAATVAIQIDPPPNSAEVRLGFDGLSWGPWQPVASGMTVAVTLPGGDGQKAVYAQFGDGSGGLSAIYALGFTLDTAAPTVHATWLGDAVVSDGGTATLAIEAHDNVSPADALQVRVVVDGAAGGWQKLAALLPVKFSQPGANVVTVQVRDQAGNVGECTLSLFN